MTYDTISNAQTVAGNSEGTILANRYRIVRQLGSGGMGSVWLAEDTQLDNKLFAIKMLPAILVANKRAYRQLKDEALVAMRLVHPNIVQIRAFEENSGNPFLVMDYIEGETLDDYLADYDSRVEGVGSRVPRDRDGRAGAPRTPLGGIPEAEVIRILKPIAAALDYAHSKGVVHRDVKPGNVMIAKDGTPYILDFGIAREIQETMTRVTGKLSSGTLPYMSPEQLNGAMPKKEQDIYSFAAMAYECLKGEPPFSRGQIDFQILNNPPPPLAGPGFVPAIAASIMAGLAKKPEKRPHTCMAVLDGNEKVSREDVNKHEAKVTSKKDDNRSSRIESSVASGFGSEMLKMSRYAAVVIVAGLLLQGVRILLDKSGQEQALPLATDTVVDHRCELKNALAQANFIAARPHAEEILKSNPDDGDANWAMGMAFFIENQYAQAMKYLKRCLVQRPQEPAVWNNLAIIYFREGSLDEAERCANKAFELLPDSTEVKDTRLKIKEAKAEAERKAREKNLESEDKAEATKIRTEAEVLRGKVEHISDADGFKDRKESLADTFSRAEDFYGENVKRWTDAAVLYRDYVEKSKVLLSLDEERQQAVARKTAVQASFRDAETAGAKTYAKTSWNAAVKTWNAATAEFGRNEFAAADKMFAKALKEFDGCADEAKNNKRIAEEKLAEEKRLAEKREAEKRRMAEQARQAEERCKTEIEGRRLRLADESRKAKEYMEQQVKSVIQAVPANKDFVLPDDLRFDKKWHSFVAEIRDWGQQHNRRDAYALIDATVFGSCDEGVLIDSLGITVRRAFSKTNGFISWTDFAKKGVVKSPWYDLNNLTLCENPTVEINLAGSQFDQAQANRLFSDLLSTVRRLMSVPSVPVAAPQKAVVTKVQLWKGGPYWADRNIGAEQPEDYGYYFWWGDTVGYKRENNVWVASDGSSSGFSFSSENTPTYNKTPFTLRSEGWITADNILAPEHDAAHVHWGGAWRMPTKQELEDLGTKCDWTWTTTNGVNGCSVRGRGDYASNSIFLSCAGYGNGSSLNYSGSYGYYWSSVPYSDYYSAYVLRFYSGYHYTSYYGYLRFYGQSVRPVQGFVQ